MYHLLFLSADSMSLPYIKCEYSESSVFESGKIYTVTEFDRIMKVADTTKHQGWLAGLQEYGSIEAWEVMRMRNRSGNILDMTKQDLPCICLMEARLRKDRILGMDLEV